MRAFLKTILLVPIIAAAGLLVIIKFAGEEGNPRSNARVYDNIKNYNDILVLVNRQNSLPEAYKPEDLITPNIRFITGVTSEEMMMRKEAGQALEELFKKAKTQGMIFYGVSGYRSYSTQSKTYSSRVKSQGKKEADKYVAYPGQSEHETGLAMDVTGETAIKDTQIGGFENTKEGVWLKNNAQNFGFIIRYPKGKESITGFNYEPWHIRYVGVNAAKAIKDKGMVLEEYME